MTDAAESLGSNIDTQGPVAPPPPEQSDAPQTVYMMAAGEQFTREEYHAAGWTDDQLILHGKMSVEHLHKKVELNKPLGMPDSTWVVLDDNDDIPPTGLFVGHNGTGYLIRSGVPVLVPNNVLKILDDAIMDAPVLDPDTRKVMSYRPRPRYTYRRVAAPVDA